MMFSVPSHFVKEKNSKEKFDDSHDVSRKWKNTIVKLMRRLQN